MILLKLNKTAISFSRIFTAPTIIVIQWGELFLKTLLSTLYKIAPSCVKFIGSQAIRLVWASNVPHFIACSSYCLSPLKESSHAELIVQDSVGRLWNFSDLLVVLKIWSFHIKCITLHRLLFFNTFHHYYNVTGVGLLWGRHLVVVLASEKVCFSVAMKFSSSLRSLALFICGPHWILNKEACTKV